MTLLGVLATLVLLLTGGDALRSCTKHGQVHVPCEDELLLGKSDRFLLTLYGHTCYSVSIVSPDPLEVLFFDSRDLKSGLNEVSGRRRLKQTEDNATESLSALGDNHMCQNVLNCYQLQEGLSKATVYNLVISRWFNSSVETTEDEYDDDLIVVAIELEHCDPVTVWHYVGLVFVGSIGFTSTMLLLCVIGEFVLGLRTISRLQMAGQTERVQRVVELPHVDPVKMKTISCEDPEEPTAPLMTTIITPTSEPAEEPQGEMEETEERPIEC